jgi:ectoine hydroxylase-related dioxygenase (phytanoyl-CoA dioxygenase family)
MQLELATGCHDSAPQWLYARHPDEVELVLDPRWVLVWNVSMWHATGPNVSGGRRRSIGWNYVSQPDERYRMWAAYEHLFPGRMESWPEERKRLWALDHHRAAAGRAQNQKTSPQPAMS